PVGGFGFLPQHLSERPTIATAKRFHQTDSLGVGRRQGRFSREIVGPFRALIDPGFDDPDLLPRERPCRRHPLAVLASGQLQIQPASRAVPWGDHSSIGSYSIRHDVPPLVQAKAIHLLLWSVTANAVRPE